MDKTISVFLQNHFDRENERRKNQKKVNVWSLHNQDIESQLAILRFIDAEVRGICEDIPDLEGKKIEERREGSDESIIAIYYATNMINDREVSSVVKSDLYDTVKAIDEYVTRGMITTGNGYHLVTREFLLSNIENKMMNIRSLIRTLNGIMENRDGSISIKKANSLKIN